MSAATVPPTVKLVTPAMRRILQLAAFLVVLLGISMYILADTTERTAAWTIQPPLTATFLGGAYFASVALQYLASRERVWARARLAVPGVVVFSFLMLAVTLRHLDRFHLGPELEPGPRFFGWIWLVTYIAVPPVMAWVWRRQTLEPGGDPAPVAPMPDGYRLAVKVLGVTLALAGVAFIAMPAVASALWPWNLTPLTARATGTWLIGLGFIAAHLGHEGDWARAWGAAWGFMAFAVLQLLALARFPGIVSYSDWRTWLFLAMVLSLGAAGAAAIRPANKARGTNAE